MIWSDPPLPCHSLPIPFCKSPPPSTTFAMFDHSPFIISLFHLIIGDRTLPYYYLDNKVNKTVFKNPYALNPVVKKILALGSVWSSLLPFHLLLPSSSFILFFILPLLPFHPLLLSSHPRFPPTLPSFFFPSDPTIIRSSPPLPFSYPNSRAGIHHLHKCSFSFKFV